MGVLQYIVDCRNSQKV